MSNPLRTPVSRELLHEHARRHATQHALPVDDLWGNELTCPCGNTMAWLCELCGWPVFTATRIGTHCEHAQEMDEWERRLGEG